MHPMILVVHSVLASPWDPAEILTLLLKGGPTGVAALAIAAWWTERRDNRKDVRVMQEMILKLAMTVVESNTKQKAALDALKDVLDKVLAKM